MSRPEKSFKMGGVSASVFVNQGEDGPFRTITLERRYKQGEEWESSNSFTKSQAAVAVIVLQRALDHVIDQDAAE